MIQYVGSNSWVIKRVPNTSAGQQRFVYADNITPGRTSLVILGGSLTVDLKAAYGYIDNIAGILNDADNIDIYSAIYNFESLDPLLVKANVFRRAGRKLKLDTDTSVARCKEQQLQTIIENEPTPGYVEDLYDFLFENTIVPNDINKTKFNMGKIVIYTHCHGATVLRQLGEMACQNMQQMGFKATDISCALRDIVVIQHNPAGPLEHQMFTMLNFMSASDDTLNFHDNFSRHVLNRRNIKPAFFGNNYNNVFIVGQMNKQPGAEHGFSMGYAPEKQYELTDDGKMIFGMEHNAINNAIKAAHSDAPKPSIEALVTGANVDFAMLSNNGKLIFDNINQR
jgi:hypothetical protein